MRATRHQLRVRLWHGHDDHTYQAFFAWEPSLQSETILFGSPARVCEQTARVLEVSGCHDVIGAFAWGTLSHDQTQRALRLFTAEVMPVFAGSATPVAEVNVRAIRRE